MHSYLEIRLSGRRYLLLAHLVMVSVVIIVLIFSVLVATVLVLVLYEVFGVSKVPGHLHQTALSGQVVFSFYLLFLIWQALKYKSCQASVHMSKFKGPKP